MLFRAFCCIVKQVDQVVFCCLARITFSLGCQMCRVCLSSHTQTYLGWNRKKLLHLFPFLCRVSFCTSVSCSILCWGGEMEVWVLCMHVWNSETLELWPSTCWKNAFQLAKSVSYASRFFNLLNVFHFFLLHWFLLCFLFDRMMACCLV